MGVTILPNPALLWDYYTSGFFPNNAGFAFSVGSFQIGNIMTAYTPLNDTSAIARETWTFGQGGSGVTSVMEFFNGNLVWRKSTTNVAAIDGMGGVAFIPLLDTSGLNAAFRVPSWQRVNWLTMNLQMDVGTLGPLSGVLLTRNDSVQTIALWPTGAAPFNNGAFGLVGNGAGNWAYESYDNGNPSVLLERVDLAAFCVDPDDFHTFDFVMISGAGGRDAVFQLLIDGVIAIERNWVDPIAIFPLAPDTYRYQPIWQVADTSDEAIRLQGWEYRMGRFAPDGRELLK